MSKDLDQNVLGQLFSEARTHNGWQDKPVEDELLLRLYDLFKWGPTSANCCPARFVFVKSPQAKALLKPCLAPGNVEKTMAAPVTVIVAYDLDFHENLPRLYPQVDARSWYVGNDALIQETAMRNGSLQGAYLILAARALGLDCGPMSGFDAEAVNQAFFAGSRWRANFLVNLGYGDPEKLYPRNPRLDFLEACTIK
ncbi:3-hydroxypropanoate dehydrogenase [Formivibrio citricus]|uniref:Putative NADH dehydrogenase/NAD(P)H nitroreductase SAMN05660284_00569 n=1 Tax=Formivibrio citricus TaxID=83765 RepID=A0A1I4WE52_9NEIS|nr:malonic semialdehyde reductase [Formivibrio citricus]SFN11918.1 3-hydroxypropanoate dehydrogenase [Formivibrio citricus]